MKPQIKSIKVREGSTLVTLTDYTIMRYTPGGKHGTWIEVETWVRGAGNCTLTVINSNYAEYIQGEVHAFMSKPTTKPAV